MPTVSEVGRTLPLPRRDEAEPAERASTRSRFFDAITPQPAPAARSEAHRGPLSLAEPKPGEIFPFAPRLAPDNAANTALHATGPGAFALQGAGGEADSAGGWLKDTGTLFAGALVADQVADLRFGFFGLFGDEKGACDLAQDAIEEGDEIAGEDRVNTDYESFALRRWLDGDGGVETLPDDLGRRALEHPNVLAGSDYIANYNCQPLPPGVESMTPITLENGERGWKAVVSFYEPDGKGGNDPFDGLFGDATVYYDAKGKPVGLYDLYDFSNDNAAVDAMNMIGDAAGADSYELKYGVGEA